MTKPRDYQLRAIEQMRAALVDARSVVYVLPTGGGKTVVFCEMIRRAAAKGKRALTLVHRVELLSQTVRALFRAGVVPGVLSAGAPPPQSDVVVAMIPTLSKRIKSDDAGLKPFDLVVVDEAHHAPAD
ncbi:MAG: DEAD/DEAH box helicase family protein, partial [Bacteroidia bacterium]|nr:DEAD/DEAH box helicase family protein [Bacteroidia bacterium]